MAFPENDGPPETDDSLLTVPPPDTTSTTSLPISPEMIARVFLEGDNPPETDDSPLPPPDTIAPPTPMETSQEHLDGVFPDTTTTAPPIPLEIAPEDSDEVFSRPRKSEIILNIARHPLQLIRALAIEEPLFLINDLRLKVRRLLDAKREFKERFSAEDIRILKQNNIARETANQYSRRFSAEDIIALHDSNIEPDVANKYSGKFRQQDIIMLIAKGITPNVASKYSTSFDILEIDKVDLDSSVYTPSEINELVLAGITPEEAQVLHPYLGELGINGIVDLAKRAKAFSDVDFGKGREGFTFRGFVSFIKEGISPETAAEYPEAILPYNIVRLAKMGLGPSAVREYKGFMVRGHGDQIVDLAGKGIGAEKAIQSELTKTKMGCYDRDDADRYGLIWSVKRIAMDCSDRLLAEIQEREGLSMSDLYRLFYFKSTIGSGDQRKNKRPPSKNISWYLKLVDRLVQGGFYFAMEYFDAFSQNFGCHQLSISDPQLYFQNSLREAFWTKLKALQGKDDLSELDQLLAETREDSEDPTSEYAGEWLFSHFTNAGNRFGGVDFENHNILFSMLEKLGKGDFARSMSHNLSSGQ